MDFLDDYDEEFAPSHKKKGIEIPEFLQQGAIADEEAQAVLNNVPNNTEIEEMNHLNELKQVCKNWKEEEWERVLLSAPSGMMADELKRRLEAFEDFAHNQRTNIDRLSLLDL